MTELQTLVDKGLITNPESARGKLLSKAAHLFREKGYERTTVRDIAKAVGIQSGSIFHHFSSKEEILKAVMTEAIHYNTARMETALAAASSARDEVLALIRCELESINGPTGEAMAILVYEWRCLSDKNQKEILSLRNNYEQLWLDALNQAKEQGLISGNTTILRRYLAGALSWTTTWYRPQGNLNLDQLADEALLLVIKK